MEGVKGKRGRERERERERENRACQLYECMFGVGGCGGLHGFHQLNILCRNITSWKVPAIVFTQTRTLHRLV